MKRIHCFDEMSDPTAAVNATQRTESHSLHEYLNVVTDGVAENPRTKYASEERNARSPYRVRCIMYKVSALRIAD
jgi:hypothetical protein